MDYIYDPAVISDLVKKGGGICAVARLTAISRQSIGGWVHGRMIPSATSLATLATALEVSPARLFRREDRGE